MNAPAELYRAPARCRCGKLSFTQDEANNVVSRALVSRVLHQNARRGEQRSYPCDVNPGFWHVTSRKDTRPLTNADGSLIVDYGSDDDMAAMSVIVRVLTVGRDHHWTTLMTAERVSQTRRVLARIRSELTAQEDAQKADLALAKERFALREIDPWEHYRAKQAYFAWKDHVATFRAALTQRLIQAEQSESGVRRRLRAQTAKAVAEAQQATVAVRTAVFAEKRNENLERAAAHSDKQNARHRAAVRDLALAIAAHRDATSEPKPADVELWAALAGVIIPHGRGEFSVGEVIDMGAWTRPFEK